MIVGSLDMFDGFGGCSLDSGRGCWTGICSATSLISLTSTIAFEQISPGLIEFHDDFDWYEDHIALRSTFVSIANSIGSDCKTSDPDT